MRVLASLRSTCSDDWARAEKVGREEGRLEEAAERDGGGLGSSCCEAMVKAKNLRSMERF